MLGRHDSARHGFFEAFAGGCRGAVNTVFTRLAAVAVTAAATAAAAVAGAIGHTFGGWSLCCSLGPFSHRRGTPIGLCRRVVGVQGRVAIDALFGPAFTAPTSAAPAAPASITLAIGGGGTFGKRGCRVDEGLRRC